MSQLKAVFSYMRQKFCIVQAAKLTTVPLFSHMIHETDRTNSLPYSRQTEEPNILNELDIHVTVHRDKFHKIKPNRCTNFSNLFLEWKSTCFGQFVCLPSGVFHCTHNNGICQNNLYDIHHCCVCSENSWWWTKELFETCRVSFQKEFWEISISIWFYIKKF